MTLCEFRKQCSSRDNLMSGVRKCFPNVYDNLPPQNLSYIAQCFLVDHLCEDTPHIPFVVDEKKNLIYWDKSGRLSIRQLTSFESACKTVEIYETLLLNYEEVLTSPTSFVLIKFDGKEDNIVTVVNSRSQAMLFVDETSTDTYILRTYKDGVLQSEETVHPKCTPYLDF